MRLSCFQELKIQSVSAEIEALKNSQNPSSSVRLEEVMEECSRLKYRVNILTRVSDALQGKTRDFFMSDNL